MTKVAQFVTLDVPHCTLTYGVQPCRAQVGFDVTGGSPTDGSQPNAVGFGDETFATRGAGLTGAADSNKATGSFWIRAFSSISGNQTLFAGATTVGGVTTRFRIRLVNGIFRITASTSAGTSTLDLRTASAIAPGSWYHILFSFDLSSTSLRHFYIDDVSSLSATTYTSNNIDYTLADWSFGALPDGTEHMDGSTQYADFWLTFGTYIDFSVSANRRAFISANGNPVYLGANGERPLGNSPTAKPIVYFGNSGTAFHTNLGTGGGFNSVDDGTEWSDEDFATGSRKCFNSLGTCQDLVDFTEETVTMWFSEDVPRDFALFGESTIPTTIFPFIKSIDYQPAIVSLEGQIGQRASLKVVFRDGRHSDSGPDFDKYSTTRGYDPYSRGTFWGKFRARNPYMRGRQVRLYIGEADQPPESLEIRYFLIDSMDGPNADGEFTITAQDILKLASGDRVVAPSPSPGFLTSDITTGNITISISPSGALATGAYDSSVFACIGGNEGVVAINISGDNIDLVDRGDLGTEESTHSAQDRFQTVLTFDAEDPADVLQVLLEEFADIDTAYIPIDDWHTESAAYLGINISLFVTEPTPVDQLIEEILETTGSAMWWDDVNQQIRWQVIRSIPTTSDRFTEENVLADTIEITEQPEKRVSQVIVYFNQINRTLKLDETRNYASTETLTDDTSEALEGSSALKIIYARTIPSGGRAVANRIATRYLSRFIRAPRRFKFELLRFSVTAPSLGGGYLLGGGEPINESWPFQDDTGARVEVPIQITRVSSTPDRWIVEAEEMLANATDDLIDTTQRYVIFDTSQNNVNLKETHDRLYSEAQSGDTVNCIISSGVTIGSNSNGEVAFNVGSGWNSGVTINVVNGGKIQGAGGKGGSASSNASSGNSTSNGQAGGTALYTRQAINLTNDSQIWGGGGGGGAAAVNTLAIGGSGGSGTNAGDGGEASSSGWNQPIYIFGNNGNATTGGASQSQGGFSASSGAGGGPGQAGSNASASGGSPSSSSGGAAGAAVDGTSFVTYLATGDRQGSLIN